jgi:hypothetical protein
MNGDYDLGSAAFNEIQSLKTRIEKLEKAVADLEGIVIRRNIAKTCEQLRREAGGE